jgi:hypothetical protein
MYIGSIYSHFDTIFISLELPLHVCSSTRDRLGGVMASVLAI